MSWLVWQICDPCCEVEEPPPEPPPEPPLEPPTEPPAPDITDCLFDVDFRLAWGPAAGEVLELYVRDFDAVVFDGLVIGAHLVASGPVALGGGLFDYITGTVGQAAPYPDINDPDPTIFDVWFNQPTGLLEIFPNYTASFDVENIGNKTLKVIIGGILVETINPNAATSIDITGALRPFYKGLNNGTVENSTGLIVKVVCVGT